MDERQLLIKSLDDELTPEERNQLKQALAGSEDLRREREQLLTMRAALSRLQPAPDDAFADRVMQRIDSREESLSAIIVRFYPKVAAASIALILIVLLAVYLTEGSLTPDTLIGTHTLTIDDAYSLATSE